MIISRDAEKASDKIQHPFFKKILLRLYFDFYLSFFCFFLTSSLEYNCFTMVCQFLPHNKVNQPHTYIRPHISSLPCLPPPILPIPPLQAVTNHPADLPVLCGCPPPPIYFTFGIVYMSMPLSHFFTAYPSPSPYPQEIGRAHV